MICCNICDIFKTVKSYLEREIFSLTIMVIGQNFVLHKHEDSALKFCINLDRTVLTGCFILCLLIGRKRWCLSSVALSPTFQLLQKIRPTLAIWSHNLFRASNDCDCPRPQRLLSHMCLQEPICFTQRIFVVGD